MKRRITLSIALVLSIVLVSLMSSDSTAKAQNQISIVADTGLITLGPNQILRLTIKAPRDPASGITTGFRRIEYSQGVCSGGICKHTISSQTTSPPITLESGEAASFDIPNTAFGVRALVESNRRDARVTVQIIDTATGQVTSVFHNITWI